ncbi:MAG TPA: DUF1015 domain-containing protein [Chitinophagaceae bacterium]|jgi:uncharacterized protein (DUF1015 family)|nr:DUF1015 domain-containing protein [Chitinophagaceae bacterium]
MAIISAFRALRPAKDLASRVASLPYDVLNSDEARVLADKNPYSFLHITKAEIDLPEGTDIHSEKVYHKAADNLFIFRDHKILIRDDEPAYYIYELTMAGRKQTGLVCVSAVSDYENQIIKKHELTRPEKELDRINHIRITGAQTGNVFLAHKSNIDLSRLISSWKNLHEPVYDFIAEDGIGHRVWVVNETQTITAITTIFENQIPCTYIADGHHRAASAAKVKKALGPDAGPDAGYFLTTLFPADELRIMDYNRVVRDLNGMDTNSFLEKLNKNFRVEKINAAWSPDRLHNFGMYLEGSWYRLEAKENSFPDDPIGILDVSILQENILAPLLDIRDPRTDNRVDFVGGIRGLSELEKRVDNGLMKVAFSLYPVSMDQLFDIADSGQIMPPKSTWFEPKLRDGLLTHLIR